MQDLESVNETLKSRESSHGDFSHSAYLCQVFKDLNRTHRVRPQSSAQTEALEMIFHKLARIIVGDPDFKDHWHDIQGYAKLVEDRLGERE